MRPVNRGAPAAGTYPLDYNNLAQDQKDLVEFLYAMLFDTMASQCSAWANTLDSDYDISDPTVREAKASRKDVGWSNLAQLQADFAAVQAAFTARPNPANPGNPPELRAMTRLYYQLKTIASLIPIAVEKYSDKVATVYPLARRQLILNIGQYCSFCEMPLAASLAIEHMLPKADFPLRALVWDNFLLACPICNSIKNKKPSRQTGVSLSPNLGAHAPPVVLNGQPTPQQEGWIVAAALGSYLWPSDAANYLSFFGAFQYDLQLILRNSDESIFAQNTLDPAKLTALIQNRRFSQAPPDDSGYVRATLLPTLFQLTGGDVATVSAYLTAIRDQQAIHSGNINAVPPALVNAFATIAAQPEMISAYQRYQIKISPDGQPSERPTQRNVKIIRMGSNEWRLTEDVTYELNLAGGITVKSTTKRQNFFEWPNRQGGVTALQNSLGNNLLPLAIATALDVDNFFHQITITRSEQDTRNIFFLVVSRNYRLRLEPHAVVCYGEHLLPIELHLAGTTPQAVRMVEELKLNKNAPSDPKNADRRMSRRLKAYFAAIESSYNLIDAEVISSALGTTVRDMVKEQAISTGFWSVWRHVMESYISDVWPQKGAVRNAINSGFAGTR